MVHDLSTTRVVIKLWLLSCSESPSSHLFAPHCPTTIVWAWKHQSDYFPRHSTPPSLLKHHRSDSPRNLPLHLKVYPQEESNTERHIPSIPSSTQHPGEASRRLSCLRKVMLCNLEQEVSISCHTAAFHATLAFPWLGSYWNWNWRWRGRWTAARLVE